MARTREGGPRTKVLELLLEKVGTDPYPSTTHMDMIEGMMDQEHLDAYAEILLSKVSDDDFPSIDHLRRLQALG